VRRGRLGVTIQAITPDLARALNLSTTTGALVSNIEDGSPAASAGLKRGDVITKLNGSAVKDSNDLRNDIAQLQPGASVDLTIVRDGKEQTLTAKLEAVEASRRAASAGSEGEGSARFGMAVEPLTAEAARELGVSTRTGVVVASVDPGSRASQAGLRAGDVIEQVDRKPVDSIDGLRSALESGDGPALLLVHRGATTVFVTMERG
jgi:S1-C subfamily serine protease